MHRLTLEIQGWGKWPPAGPPRVASATVDGDLFLRGKSVRGPVVDVCLALVSMGACGPCRRGGRRFGAHTRRAAGCCRWVHIFWRDVGQARAEGEIRRRVGVLSPATHAGARRGCAAARVRPRDLSDDGRAAVARPAAAASGSAEEQGPRRSSSVAVRWRHRRTLLADTTIRSKRKTPSTRSACAPPRMRRGMRQSQ
jgi:hypothetical protein